MQALSTWPSSNESWLLAQLDSELGSSSNSRRRSKILYFSCSLFHVTNVCRLHIASKTCITGQNWGLRCNLFSRYSTCLFSKPERGSFGASYALTWALEEKAISDQLNGVSENGENEVLGCIQLKGVRDRDLSFSKVDIDNGQEKEENTGTMEKVAIARNGRVDVRALGSSLHLARTADDVEEILKGKGELPLQVYSSLIRGFGKDKRLDCAMALFEWLKRRSQQTDSAIRLNLFIYNSLLGAIKQAEKYDVVDKVISDMLMEGLHPNVITYNTLMAIYIEQGREFEALNLFEDIPKQGLSPTPASYSTALLAYQKLGDGFGALKFFADCKDKYQKGEIGNDGDQEWDNEFAKLENFTIRMCFQVMRQWLVKSKNSSHDILSLLKEMDNAGLQTGRAEHERLVWACTREEHYIVAKELYNRIREKDSEISLSVCNHVIWLMGKAKKWWAALEIYEDLLDRGPKPNNLSYELIVSHFNILLSAARKRGIWRWGVRLLNKMEEKGLKPGSREWNSVLVACSKASETSAAVQIFKRMVEQGEKPTVISYGALLSALEKGKLYEEALQVWKNMVKVGVKPNLYAYTIMASIYTAQGKFNIVNSIIKEMVIIGVEPTVVTFNAIISGCAKNNMASSGYEWFQRMKDHNVSPNEVTYDMLIEALANDGKPRLAYELYSRAHIEGLRLSSKAYDAVIRSSQIYGATIDVSTLGTRPPEKNKLFHIRKNLSDSSGLVDVPRRSQPFDTNEIHTVHRKLNH